MRVANLTVPQGIGDIFWIIQKYHHHYDVINLNIAVVKTSEIQLRAVDFVKLFPKVGNVDFEVMSGSDHKKLVQYDGKMVQSGNYGCNMPLERGIRLEDIDPDIEVAWDLELAIGKNPLHIDTDYLVLYVSGHSRNSRKDLWSVDQWIDFICDFYSHKWVDLPLVLLGAEYDRDVLEEIKAKVPMTTHLAIAFDPAEVLAIIRDALYFIGYQSGLGILADNLDTPQLMMYFEKLSKMMNTWHKPDSVGFEAATFDMNPKDVLEGIKWEL